MADVDIEQAVLLLEARLGDVQKELERAQYLLREVEAERDALMRSNEQLRELSATWQERYLRRGDGNELVERAEKAEARFREAEAVQAQLEARVAKLEKGLQILEFYGARHDGHVEQTARAALKEAL